MISPARFSFTGRAALAVALFAIIRAAVPASAAPPRDTPAGLAEQVAKGPPAARSEAVRQLAAADAVEAAVAAVVPALTDADAGVRFTAALAVATLAGRAADLDQSADAADDAKADPDDDDDRDPFADAVPHLLAMLADSDPHLVRAAAAAIGAIGPLDGPEPADDAVDALRRALAAAGDPETRAACIVAIADYGPAAESAVTHLIRALGDQSAVVREAAAAALAAIGPEARAASGPLAKLLRGDEPLVRAAAAAALAGIGPDARGAVTALTAAIGDPDPLVRGTVVRALAAIGPDAAPATGGLVAGLAREGDADVTIGMIEAFGAIGPQAREAVPALVERLSSPVEEVRLAAVDAIGQIGAVAAATAAAGCERLLGDPSRSVRVAAAGALIGMERVVPRVRGVLSDALAADDPDVQAEAARTIGDWGAAGRPFTKPLAELVTGAKDPDVRAAAATALGDVGATTATAALGAALDDDDADVRCAAAYAVADMPEAARALVRQLVAAVDDDDVRVRIEVATALAHTGDPSARKALETLAADDDANVAAAAEDALAGLAAR